MRQVDMSDMVHLLWFVKEMPEGEDDIELLIGVYSSDEAARAAIERMEEKPGFADFPQGFEVCPYPLDRDYWTEDFVVERQPLPAAIRHAHAEFVVPSLTAGPTRKPSPPERRPRRSIPRFSRHQNSTETAPRSHAFTPSFAYSPFVMRGAFVVQLGSETRPAEVGFEGWDEEDDSYTEQQLQLVCGFGAGQPIATRETSFVLSDAPHLQSSATRSKRNENVTLTSPVGQRIWMMSLNLE